MKKVPDTNCTASIVLRNTTVDEERIIDSNGKVKLFAAKLDRYSTMARYVILYKRRLLLTFRLNFKYTFPLIGFILFLYYLIQ